MVVILVVGFEVGAVVRLAAVGVDTNGNVVDGGVGIAVVGFEVWEVVRLAVVGVEVVGVNVGLEV